MSSRKKPEWNRVSFIISDVLQQKEAFLILQERLLFVAYISVNRHCTA